MAGVNKVILVGNLGSDPEIRSLPSGSTVATFNIATSEAYNNKNGERVEQTEWHRIELWDNLAKIAEQYLKKGNQVYVEGKLRTETWVDKEGQQKSGVRVRGTSMTLLGTRNSGGDSNEGAQSGGSQAAPVNRPATSSTPRQPDPIPSDLGSGGDDDLPF
jgi:single-strand DNA-binding protein